MVNSSQNDDVFGHFDVFLSHNSHDKPLVEQIAQRLVAEAKLRPFLDKWHLIPGESWQQKLPEAIRRSSTVAAFIGPSGNGPWHDEEMQLALMRAVREKKEFRVIPVLLPKADASSMPEFLQLRTWVDFSAGTNNDIAFKRLVAGILGKAGDGEFEDITLPDEPSPYRGLMQFKPEHARFFFGREQDIGPTRDKPNLIDKLRTQQFVAVVGSSGSGKSSLVGAGLLPRLAQDAIPGSKYWSTVTFTPADDPWRSLAVALASSHPSEKRGAIVTGLLSQLDEPEDGLRHTLETWFADTTEPLLLFVDQFEELFTHAPNARANAAAREKYDERVGRFVRQLAHEVLSPNGRFRVVITLRADFMPHCLRMPELKGLLQDRQLLLGELATDEAALREVIQRPAQEVGALLETGLMEVLLADVRRQTGALPLLEHALSELWRERHGPWLPLAAYQKTGGVSGALEQRAEETLKRLTEPQQRIARRIFVKLTSLEEDTENTRRRVDRKSLYAETTDSAEIDAVINVLAGPAARLIVADADSLSIAHETLIQNWPRVRIWLTEDSQLERIHRELERAANEWNANARSNRHLFHASSAKLAETEEHLSALADRTTTLEREFLTACRQERDAETRRLRRRVQVVASIACIALLMLGLAVFQWRIANQEKTKAVHAQMNMEDALVGSFFRTIGVPNQLLSVDSTRASPDERAALWDLAELKPDNMGVREKLIECWFANEELSKRPLARGGLGLRAANGLQLNLRLRTTTHAALLADLKIKALENPQETNLERLSHMRHELAALANGMAPSDMARIMARGADSLVKAMDNPQETDVKRLSHMGHELAALVDRMAPSDLARMKARGADSLVKAMGNLQETDTNRLAVLAGALAALVSRMAPPDSAHFAARGADRLAKTLENPQLITFFFEDMASLDKALTEFVAQMDSLGAASVAERLTKSLESPQEDDLIRLSCLRTAMTAMSVRMAPPDAARVADRFIDAIENHPEPHSRNLKARLADLFSILTMLAARMDPPDAARITARGADWLTNTLENLGESNLALFLESARVRAEGNSGLVALAARMSPSDVARIADRLLNTLANWQNASIHEARLADLVSILTALAARMDPPDAARIADRLLDTLANWQNASIRELNQLGSVLAVLATRLAPSDAVRVTTGGAHRLAKALADSKVTDDWELERLELALATLAGRMDAPNAARVAEGLHGALDNPQENNRFRRWHLRSALTVLAVRMNPPDVARVAVRVATALSDPQFQKNARHMSILGSELAALVPRMDPPDAIRLTAPAADRLVEALVTSSGWPDDFDKVVTALTALTAPMEPSDVARITGQLAKALENPKVDHERLPWLSSALAALATRIEASDVTRIAAELANALENPEETSANRLSLLGIALGALAARMDHSNSARLTARGADRLAKALIAPPETKTHPPTPSKLPDAFAALAALIAPSDAAHIASHLANALENPEETDPYRLSSLGSALVVLTERLPSARQTRLLGASNLLLGYLPPKPSKGKEDERQFTRLCMTLSHQELADMLKWPFCVGEAEQIVLAKLERQTGQKFGGDVWKFVEQAPTLGIKNLDAPAKRPRLEDVLKELETILKAAEKSP